MGRTYKDLNKGRFNNNIPLLKKPNFKGHQNRHNNQPPEYNNTLTDDDE